MADKKYYKITYSVLLDPDDVARAKRILAGDEAEDPEFENRIIEEIEDEIHTASFGVADAADAIPE